MSLVKVNNSSSSNHFPPVQKQSKQSFCQRLIEKIKEIWRSFCNFICCRTCSKSITQPETITSSKTITLETSVSETNKTSSIVKKPEKPTPIPSPKPSTSQNKDKPTVNLVSVTLPIKPPHVVIEPQKPTPIANPAPSSSQSKDKPTVGTVSVTLPQPPLITTPQSVPSTVVANPVDQKEKPIEEPKKPSSHEMDVELLAHMFDDMSEEEIRLNLEGIKVDQKKPTIANPAPSQPIDQPVIPTITAPLVVEKPAENKDPAPSVSQSQQQTVPVALPPFQAIKQGRVLGLQSVLIGSTPKPYPAYAQPILNGNPEEILREGFEKGATPQYCGKGELICLGECACPSLCRKTVPHGRNQFDEMVLQYTLGTIALKNEYRITHFASGDLFSVFVQTIQLFHALKEKNWQGKIILDVIDIEYRKAIEELANDMHGFYRTEFNPIREKKMILSFRDLISSFIPEGVVLQLNVYPSGYEFESSFHESQTGYRIGTTPDLIIGMDTGNATKDFEKGFGVEGPYTMKAVLTREWDEQQRPRVLIPHAIFERPTPGADGQRKFTYQPKPGQKTFQNGINQFINLKKRDS